MKYGRAGPKARLVQDTDGDGLVFIESGERHPTYSLWLDGAEVTIESGSLNASGDWFVYEAGRLELVTTGEPYDLCDRHDISTDEMWEKDWVG